MLWTWYMYDLDNNSSNTYVSILKVLLRIRVYNYRGCLTLPHCRWVIWEWIILISSGHIHVLQGIWRSQCLLKKPFQNSRTPYLVLSPSLTIATTGRWWLGETTTQGKSQDSRGKSVQLMCLILPKLATFIPMPPTTQNILVAITPTSKWSMDGPHTPLRCVFEGDIFWHPIHMYYVYMVSGSATGFFFCSEISAFFAKIFFYISVVILNSSLHYQIFKFDINIQILYY